MTQRLGAIRRYRRYGAWLLLALLMFTLGFVVRAIDDVPQITDPSGNVLPAPLYVRDTKVRRTARSFAMLASVQDDTPLHTFNEDGLSIDIELDRRTWQLMLVPDNRRMFKTRSYNVAISFGGRESRPAVLSLRGGGSLKAPGKPNFDIKLFRSEQFTETLEMRRFYLMNMHYDKAEIDLTWSYGLLNELGLFPLHYQYVRVAVNGDPLGMYLLVEPPDRGLRRHAPDTVGIYRRRSANVYQRLWSKGVPSPNRTISALRALNYADTVEDPVAAYQQRIDLDAYMRWTAFNALVVNYDTIDELFLYEVREERERPVPLRVMAWDYDDIYFDGEKDDAVDDPLMHSALGDFDAAIVREPELYERYRAVMREMLVEQLPVDHMIEYAKAMQAKRDGLDDGRPEEVQAEARQARRRLVREFLEDIETRHAELLDLVQ
jgi:hypothetical protein